MKNFKLNVGRRILAALLLSLLLVPTIAQAQNLDILKIFNEVINQHNPDEAIKYFTDDATVNFPGQPPVQGKAAILAFAKQSGLFAADPTLKIIIAPHVEGNKVLERTSSLPPQFSQQGEAGRLVFDSITEFQGDKIKSFSLIPTPETLQKLTGGAGQGGPPGAPNAGTGGTATSASVQDNWLTLALLASGAVVILAAGLGLMMSRKTTRR